jgi:hypothetical protein
MSVGSKYNIRFSITQSIEFMMSIFRCAGLLKKCWQFSPGLFTSTADQNHQGSREFQLAYKRIRSNKRHLRASVIKKEYKT